MFRHFWLLSLGVLLLNLAIWHRRAGELIKAGEVSEDERDDFIRRLAVAIVLFCLTMQAVVWITGESRPACLAAFPPRTAASLASSVVTLAVWVALLWWVWTGRGAQQLARFGPALHGRLRSRGHFTPGQIRWAVTAFVGVSALGGVGASLVMPATQSCGP